MYSRAHETSTSLTTSIDELDLASLVPQMLEAVRDNRPPVDVVLREFGLQQPSEDAEAVLRALDMRIAVQLEPHGIRRCRHVRSLVSGWTDAIRRTIFYRPTELQLLDALADPHPIVLATTFEPQRYVDALTRHSKGTAAQRDVWIWKGAAGEGVAERVVGADVVGLHLVYMNLEEHTPPIETTLADLVSQADDVAVHQTSLDVDGQEMPYAIIRKNPTDPVLMILVDDRALEHDFDREAVTKRINAEVIAYVSSNRENFESFVRTEPVPGFLDVLRFTRSLTGASICVIPDAHHFLGAEQGNPAGLVAIGALKDTYHRLVKTKSRVKLVLLCGDAMLPKDLREEVLVVDLPLPGRRELHVEIGRLIASHNDDEHDDETTECIARLSEEAAGMTLAEVNAVIKRTLSASGSDTALLLAALRHAKRRHIARSPALELIDASNIVPLGGMERFLQWLSVRKKAFKQPERAKVIGIDRTPRGVLLLGIPGSGKSLAAKAIARDWKLPLVRFDVGALRNVFVGSSEARTREALRVVEAMAPCILWVDEIDKGMGQGTHVSASTADLNIKATLLTWMQETQHPIFIVATANRFSELPPELTRAGRFDARFFFGCPGVEGRKEIFRAHLVSRAQDLGNFNFDEIAKATHGFTGAEIEQVILDSLYVAFEQEETLSMATLRERATATKPLIRSAGKGLDEVWELIDQGRVELASSDMLTRSQVAQLIDPYLYRSIYCQLEKIEGFERACADASRILMGSPYGGPAAAVMETGEDDWIYVQTNFTRRPGDTGNFKFLDQFLTIESNLVFDSLVTDHALETIYFQNDALKRRFEQSSMLSAYVEMFRSA